MKIFIVQFYQLFEPDNKNSFKWLISKDAGFYYLFWLELAIEEREKRKTCQDCF